MHSLRIRVIVVIVLLGLAGAVSALTLYPKRMDRGSLRAVRLPLTLGAWAGVEKPVEDYVKQILETDDVIQREYINPLFGSAPVQMAVVFSADNRRVAHPPEVCYRGSGWEVNDKRIVSLEGLPDMVRMIMSVGGANKDLVMYCYKAGDELTASFYRQQLNIVFNQLRRRAVSSAMIRFSTPVTDGEEQAQRKIEDFARQMFPRIRSTLHE